MLSKKAGLLAGASSNLHLFHGAAGSSTSSTLGTRHQVRRAEEGRRYATIAGDGREGHHSEQEEPKREPEHQWPSPTKGQQHPTPYQIFAMKNDAAYSKGQFYQLVKLYHPDRKSISSIAHQLKIERYHLLVAAHTILSDPVKRSAYDRFGAGWNGKAEAGAQGGAHPGPGPFSHSWQGQGQNDPIWNNATWEDWERFYAWRARKNGDASAGGVAQDYPQSPLYMRNSYFVVLVVILAFFGGSANYNRAQDAGAYFVEQRDLVHDRSAKELRKVRQEMEGLNRKDERIHWFLRQREATMGAMSADEVEVMRQERASRMLADREVCQSDELSGKDP